MRKGLYILCASLLYIGLLSGGSVHLMNDSPYTLRAVIRGADGTYLGEVLVLPQNMSSWNDWNSILGSQGMGPYQGGNFYSQTPYTVIWYCMDGGEYGINNVVGAGATVLAQYSQGARICQQPPPKSGAFPNQPQGYLNEQSAPEAGQ